MEVEVASLIQKSCAFKIEPSEGKRMEHYMGKSSEGSHTSSGLVGNGNCEKQR